MPIYFYPSSHHLPLNIESIGNQWTQDTVGRPQGYPYYHWLQSNHGQGKIQIGDQSILLAEGAGILLFPFTPHHYAPVYHQWQTSFATFYGSLASDLLQPYGQEGYLMIENKRHLSAVDWIDTLIAEDQQSGTDPLRSSSRCYHFLLTLLQEKQGILTEQHPLYQQILAPVIKEIETNYDQNLTISQLAGMVYVSPQYLSRLFNRFLGQSTSQYLLNYRINRAKEYLVTQKHVPIQQVAFAAGFQDASHFTALFKKRVGITPMKFRQLYH